MNKTFKTELQKIGIIFLFGFFIYIGLEVIFRTVISFDGVVPSRGLLAMGILGGTVVIILGYINEIKQLRILPFWLHCIIGAIIVTCLEWLTGRILNIHLGWNIWNYKHLILSTPDGQINLFFSLIWLGLSPVAFWLDDSVRHTYEIIKLSGLKKSKKTFKLRIITKLESSIRAFKIARFIERQDKDLPF